MNTLDENYLANGYSEAHKILGFPAMFFKSTPLKDKFNHAKVALVPATAVVYVVYAHDEMKDDDLVAEQTSEGSLKDKAIIKVIRHDLQLVGIPKVELRDIVEIDVNGEKKKYIVAGFSNKNELPNIFYRLKITVMKDLNVSEV